MSMGGAGSRLAAGPSESRPTVGGRSSRRCRRGSQPQARPAFGRPRLARPSSQPAACAAHAHTYIYATHIYTAAAKPHSLLEHDPSTGRRDSVGPATIRLPAPPLLVHLYMRRIYVHGCGYNALTLHMRPAFGRARLARASSQPAACAAHAHTHICNAYIYMVAATPRSLLERDPPTGGRD